MIGLLLLAVPFITADAQVDSLREANLFSFAEEAYRAGLEARTDAAKARLHFRQAASAYEKLWQLGHRNPALARDLAQAHFLAGDLARTIRAYHFGLRLAPHDPDLQAGLAFARAQVPYPVTGNLAESCRPRERSSLLHHASADALKAIAAGLYLLACLACVAPG